MFAGIQFSQPDRYFNDMASFSGSAKKRKRDEFELGQQEKRRERGRIIKGAKERERKT
jgi:hypothetical protein